MVTSVFAVAIVLTANHPRKSPASSVWTFWGADEELLGACLSMLAAHSTPLSYRHRVNPEIAALVLRNEDRLGTILGAWTRAAVPELVAVLPPKLGDLRHDLIAAFDLDPSAARST